MAQVSQSAIVQSKALASDHLRSSRSSIYGVPLRTLGMTRSFSVKRRDVCVSAKLRKKPKRQHQYPWPRNPDPNVKGGVLSHLSAFKPLTEKPKPVILDFEKPLLDLEKKIIDVKNMAKDTGLDFTAQIESLEKNYQQTLKELYLNLTPIQRVSIARHPNRPTCLDHVFNITEKFVELHGDRCGYDDPAIVTGLGTIEGRTYMFIGHQKGRNTKENIKRNFGMPTPHGYRKALRMMYYADHHNFPIITFIDTPGAYADLKSETLGQGEAIAHNLRTMFGLKVPIISVVIGEGGSGGALAIGCANKLLFLENAVFYVASPEACAAILWKSAKAAPKAAKKLKITATELTKLGICDGVISEPLGGAHTDPAWTSQQIKEAVVKEMDELLKMDTQTLLQHRHMKFRKLGGFEENLPISPKKKANMKKREAPMSLDELELEVKKLEDQVVLNTGKPKTSVSKQMAEAEIKIKELRGKLVSEYSQAYEALQLKSRRLELEKEFKEAEEDGVIPPALLEKREKFFEEVRERLPSAPNYAKLRETLDLLNSLLNSLKKEMTPPRSVSLKSKTVARKPTLDEAIEKLEREVLIEYYRAHEALQMMDRRRELEKEIEEAQLLGDQLIYQALLDKMKKFSHEVYERLPSAPNHAKLMKMLDMLKRLMLMQRKKMSKVKNKLKETVAPPRPSLDELIAKLERDVATEYSLAFKALQLTSRRLEIQKEIDEAERTEDQLFHQALQEKKRRFLEEVNERLPSAPNYTRLRKKLDVLESLTKGKKTSEAKIKSDRPVSEMTDKIKSDRPVSEMTTDRPGLLEKVEQIRNQIMNRPDIQEKLAMLDADIARSGAVSYEDLDSDLKERLAAVDKEIETELVKSLESSNLKVIDPSEAFDEFEKVIRSSGLENEIEMLRLEMEKAGDNPTREMLDKFEALTEKLRERVEKDPNASEQLRKLREECGFEDSQH